MSTLLERKARTLVVAVVPSLLVQNGVQSDGSLARLTITDNQLTLATTNRHHGVNTLDARLHGLVDRLAGDNARSLDLDTGALDVLQRTL